MHTQVLVRPSKLKWSPTAALQAGHRVRRDANMQSPQVGMFFRSDEVWSMETKVDSQGQTWVKIHPDCYPCLQQNEDFKAHDPTSAGWMCADVAGTVYWKVDGASMTYKCVGKFGVGIRSQPSLTASKSHGPGHGEVIQVSEIVSEGGLQWLRLADGRGYCLYSQKGEALFVQGH